MGSILLALLIVYAVIGGALGLMVLMYGEGWADALIVAALWGPVLLYFALTR